MSFLNQVSFEFITLLTVFFCWSFGLFIYRSYHDKRKPATLPSDSREKLICLLYCAPALVAPLVFLLQLAWPSNAWGIPTQLNAELMPLDLAGLKPLITPPPLNNANLSLVSILSIIYITGVLVSLARLFSSHFKLDLILKNADLANEVERGDILITYENISPFVHISGKIVLPKAIFKQLSFDQIELIIAHERNHISRNDAQYFLVLAIIDAVSWLNPFIKHQTSRCRLAAEIDCDSLVLQENPDKKNEYALSIINTLETLTLRTPASVAAFLNYQKNGEFRMRINQIIQGSTIKPASVKKSSLVLASAALTSLACMQFALAGTQTLGTPDFIAKIVEGEISSTYGIRTDPINQKERTHKGTDIKAPLGTKVTAPADGIVISTQNLPKSYGLLLTLDHGNGYVSRYANLSSFEVEEGQKVKAGQLVARVGSTGRSTGPHLHVELWKDGEHLDPETMLNLPE